MITANVFRRVFFINDVDYGTAFCIDYEGKQYLVTARHLIDPKSTSSIKFFFDEKWIELPVKLVGVGKGSVDVAVFAADVSLCSKELLLEPTSKDIVVSQDIYFVGYPYKMWTNGGTALAGAPCPFIKKGILASAFVSDDGVPRLYIDALNNPGFSGGPIVFQVPGERDFKIAGVVSSFKTEIEPVIDNQGEPTGMTIAYNTGFLIGFDISEVLKIIDRNPIGVPV